MLREISFRALRLNKSDGFVYGSYLVDVCGHYISDMEGNDICVLQETFGQYTGLKDSTGRRIYEGDILHKPNQSFVPKFVIEWNVEKCKFDDFPTDGSGAFIDLIGFEVIGNIHEHKHLL